MVEPPQLAARPHWGEFAIPFVTHVREDGRPDFRVHDNKRRDLCATEHLCQLCGTALGDRFAFIGTRRSTQRRTFGEPPMHLDCMEWAWRVCPWLGGRDHRPGLSAELTLDHKTSTAPRDRYMAVFVTDGYQVQPDREGSGSIVWIASAPMEVVAFRDRG